MCSFEVSKSAKSIFIQCWMDDSLRTFQQVLKTLRLIKWCSDDLGRFILFDIKSHHYFSKWEARREREREREQKWATTKIMFITASGLGEFHADKMHYQINVPVYLMVHKRINIWMERQNISFCIKSSCVIIELQSVFLSNKIFIWYWYCYNGKF